MNPIETIQSVRGAQGRGEDRLAVLTMDDRTVIAVSDGAGGSGSGGLAADFVIQKVRLSWREIDSPQGWANLLQQVDCEIPAGEATVVVVDIRSLGIIGASVGDSQAVIVRNDEVVSMTAQQRRKPLLGSRECSATGLEAPPMQGILVVGTDGVFNYLSRLDLVRICQGHDFFEIPRLISEKVRLPSGEYWDDIAIVAARVRPVRRSRQRYEI